MDIIIASNNKHKIEELKRILSSLNINVFSLKDKNITIEDIEENGSTFAENAMIKAKAVYDITHTPAIADDSGLCVDALGGKPGVYTARYAGEGASDEDKYNKILKELDGIEPEKRTARFVSAICLIINDNTIITAEGICEGAISYSPKGENGFGYDPIFLTEFNKTFSELTDKEKDSISHRGLALRDLHKKLSDYFGNK